MLKHKYQLEYENSICFWGTKPAKFVQLFVDKYAGDLTGKKILDIGAGEGKNSVFLATHGAQIIAVDISEIALQRFNQQPGYDECKDKFLCITADLKNINFLSNSFDAVVAYGVLHCLENNEEIKEVVTRIKNWVKKDGYSIISTFTNNVPIPAIQEYLKSESLLEENEIEKMFSNWNILACENDIITETHPTSLVEHSHSLVRLIAKKYE